MITVACVYWVGKFRGREKVYNKKYVERLKNMVSRNLSDDFRFVCLTNTNVDCDSIKLKHNLPGWWSKLELFSGCLSGRVVYIDLDVVIVNDIKPIADYKSEFAIVRGFGSPNKEIGTVHGYNSSVMVFDADKAKRFWDNFTPDCIEKYRGDQDYIASVDNALDILPKYWVDKLKYLDGKPKDETKIVLCMPEKNAIASKKYEWVKKAWA